MLTMLLLALTAALSPALAQPGANEPRTTEALLPHCSAALKPDAQDATGGRCLGIIATLSFVSRVLPDNLKFCQPPAATPALIVQAIVAFAQANPESSAQDFRLVALAAMRDK